MLIRSVLIAVLATLTHPVNAQPSVSSVLLERQKKAENEAEIAERNKALRDGITAEVQKLIDRTIVAIYRDLKKNNVEFIDVAGAVEYNNRRMKTNGLAGIGDLFIQNYLDGKHLATVSSLGREYVIFYPKHASAPAFWPRVPEWVVDSAGSYRTDCQAEIGGPGFSFKLRCFDFHSLRTERAFRKKVEAYLARARD